MDLNCFQIFVLKFVEMKMIPYDYSIWRKEYFNLHKTTHSVWVIVDNGEGGGVTITDCACDEVTTGCTVWSRLSSKLSYYTLYSFAVEINLSINSSLFKPPCILIVLGHYCNLTPLFWLEHWYKRAEFLWFSTLFYDLCFTKTILVFHFFSIKKEMSIHFMAIVHVTKARFHSFFLFVLFLPCFRQTVSSILFIVLGNNTRAYMAERILEQ